ncbi:MAG: acetate--CoA ligase family protein, partial [Nitrospirae bacterium]|nr:acetate--CoA ligase family protein [Nitrospirota bacterium]
KALLKTIGIAVPEHFVAQDKDDALHAANTIGWPVAMKIVSPDILHKSDVGGVKLNIKNKDELYIAFDAMMEDIAKKADDAMIKGALIEAMAKKGTEIIIGGIRDAQFGPAVMFGIGGIFVELLKDVSFGIAPVNMDEAMEMIKQIKGYPLLTGFRGSLPVDIDAIAKALITISELLNGVNDISEIDLNPVIVYPQGLVVVDAKVLLSTNKPPLH